MRIKINSLIILISGILLLNACAEDNNDKEINDLENENKINLIDTKDILKPDLGGIIRGINLNDDINKVKSFEKVEALTEETQFGLTYNYKLEDENSYDIYYEFGETGLFQIVISTSFTEKNAEHLLKTIKDSYSAKCINIIDKDQLLTMDGKNNEYYLDVDYVDISKGIIDVSITAVDI